MARPSLHAVQSGQYGLRHRMCSKYGEWSKTRPASISEKDAILFLDQAQVDVDKTFAHQHNEGADGFKLSAVMKVLYGGPMFTITAVTMLISIHGTIFFTEAGASLVMLSFFTAAARSLDTVTDPAMGFISDTYNSKEGRRRPFMIRGCWGYSLVLVLLFSPPPGISSGGVAAWFGVFYVTFYLFDTLTNVPYGALGPELSNKSEERNSLYFVAGLFKGCGILVAAAMPVFFQLHFQSDGTQTTYGYLSVDCTCKTTVPIPTALNDSSVTFETCGPAGTASPLPATSPPLLRSWCTEYRTCQSGCQLGAKRMAFNYTAMFFAFVYLAFMVFLVFVVKERKVTDRDTGERQEVKHLVPSLMVTLRNQPFMKLLPAWVCDFTSFAMIGTMLPFFVQYVVAPASASPWCDNGKRCPGLGSCNDDSECCLPEEEDPAWCTTSLWIGVGLVALMLATIISMPIWLWATKKYGKYNTWMAYNLFTALTNGLFVFVGEGHPKLCVGFAFLNGLPNGAQFITESILADVIDYDEFLTGVRSEGRFTIFTTFIPKVVSIPAQALPLAALAAFGFVSPIDGEAQPQPPAVIRFIKVVFFVFPFILALISYQIKSGFPLKTAKHNRMIQEGIALHRKGEAALDPVTKQLMPVFTPSGASSMQLPETQDGADAGEDDAEDIRLGRRPSGMGDVWKPHMATAEEQRDLNRFDTFTKRELRVFARVYVDRKDRELERQMSTQYRKTVALSALFFVLLMYGLVHWLSAASTAWMPAMSIIGLSLCLCLTYVTTYRLRVVRSMYAENPPLELLDRYLVFLEGVNMSRNRQEMRRLNECVKRICRSYKVIDEEHVKDMIDDLFPHTRSIQADIDQSSNETRRKTFGQLVWQAKHNGAGTGAGSQPQANGNGFVNEIKDDLAINGDALDENDWSEAAALAETLTVSVTPALQADAMQANWSDLDSWNGAPAANAAADVTPEEPTADAQTLAGLPAGKKIQV